ncbi:MAG: amidohydrolase [Desulfobacterales bacterium]|nr:amidohydrolase [Desulfobacterales bacterium]
MTRKLIHNVTIRTMDSLRTVPASMAWESTTILGLGEKADLIRRFGPMEEIDGEGRTVLPGFIDPHIHFFDGALFRGALDCSPAATPDLPTMIEALAAQAARHPDDEWIFGQGYDPAALPGHMPPTRAHLDRACPDRPTAVFHYSMHECVVNSAALALLGIGPDTPQPHAGEIVRDRTGQPTGGLVEMAMGRVATAVKHSMLINRETQIKARLKACQADLFKAGITAVGDPAVSCPTLEFYESAFADGTLSIPVTAFPCDDTNFFGLPGDRAGQPPTRPNDPRLTLGPLKIFLDGADRASVRLTPAQAVKSGIGTAARAIESRSFAPFRLLLRSPGQPDGHGVRFGVAMVDDTLGQDCIRRAVASGYTLAFHAIGNAAVDQALTLMHTAGKGHPDSPPPRIEHALFLTPDLIPRIKSGQMAVVTQPAFLDFLGAENVPPLPGFLVMPLKTLIASGICVAGSSDWPVSSFDPLLAIQRAVTRTSASGESLQPGEAIPVEAALAMHTINAARVLGKENETGSLEPGKRADFILLSDDPLTSDPEKISNIRVVKTYLGGKKAAIPVKG